MRTLIGIFTFALCGLLCFQTANAQSKTQGHVIDAPAIVKVVQKTFENRSPEEAATLQTNSMAQKLNLSTAQANELYQVNLQTAKEVAKLRENRTSANFQQNIKSTYSERRTDVNSVLNAEQQKKYKTNSQKITSFKKKATSVR